MKTDCGNISLHQNIMNLRYITIKMNNKNNKQLMNNDFLFTFDFCFSCFCCIFLPWSRSIHVVKVQPTKLLWNWIKGKTSQSQFRDFTFKIKNVNFLSFILFYFYFLQAHGNLSIRYFQRYAMSIKKYERLIKN